MAPAPNEQIEVLVSAIRESDEFPDNPMTYTSYEHGPSGRERNRHELSVSVVWFSEVEDED